MKPVPFASEAEMCGVFIAAIGPDWTAYAETAGWDILLVRRDDGFQIGVEAKLRLNAEVITQALEDSHDRNVGPDYRAVLVPRSSGFERIAAYCGLTVITIRRYGCGGPAFSPYLPKAGDDVWWMREWHEQLPSKRHALPDYVPDVAAGMLAGML